MIKYTSEQHRSRHVLLLHHLNEIVEDYIVHNPCQLPCKASIEELQEWSFKQASNPDHDD